LRDSKGRFVKGHRFLPSRDSRTGKFVKKNPMDLESRYSMVSKEVDVFLKQLKEADIKI
jgi:hypothetical protein